MTYKCLECGHIFEEGEEGHYFENGECWGAPYSHKIYCCPLCKGDYDVTTPCEICGSEHLDKELVGGICEECLEEYRYDIKTCYEIGKNDTEKVELNCFFTALFDREEIEEILLNAVLQEEKIHGKVDCQKFIDTDKSWFAERLVEELEKEKK